MDIYGTEKLFDMEDITIAFSILQTHSVTDEVCLRRV